MRKKWMIIGVIVMLAVIAAGCASTSGTAATTRAVAENDPNFNYRVTGQFAGWGQTFEAQYMMENVAKDDPRIAPIHAALADANYVYLYEYTPDTANPAGWTTDFPGAGISVDGNFCVKIIRLIADSTEASGWFFDMWIPSTEAGGVSNLSPNTFFTPMARTDEEADAAGDGLGSNNGNPVLLKAGTYYIVFAVMNDRSRAMGAVAK